MSIPICNVESFYYIALYKDKIVGGVGLRKILPRDNNLWQISGLSILHDLRGYGIGEKFYYIP